MEPNPTEIAHEFLPYFRVYKDGLVERLQGTERVLPSDDPQTGVQCKDTLVSQENNLSARLFLPKISNQNHKIPLVIYIHGGAFSVQSPFSPLQYDHLVSLANKANALVVAIQYRRAPEHPLPIAYGDSWAQIQWVVSHVNGHGPEPWLNEHANFERLFLVGSSAGANIAHNIAIRVGNDGLVGGVKIVGVVLMHPYFGNNELSKLLAFIFPLIERCTGPCINPVGAGVDLASLGCTRMLICVASEDRLRDRGVTYYEALRKSGWPDGMVEIIETGGEDHVFFVLKPFCDEAKVLMDKVVSFINED